MKTLNYGAYATLTTGLVMSIVMLSACSEPEPPKPSAGELVFNKTCKVCHAQGLNGAPILGNKKMWAKRAQQEVGVLVEHATNGFGLMPAKGGNEQLTEAEIKAAVEFMLSKLE